MKQKKYGSELVPIYILIAVTFFLIVESLYNGTYNEIDIRFIVTNALIGLIALTMIIVESRRHLFSLHLMHWLFQYVFFFIAPLVQYLNNSFQWGLLHSDDSNMLIQSNLIILLWQNVWIVSKAAFGKSIERKVSLKENSPVREELPRNSMRVLVLFVLSTIVLLAMISFFGITGLYMRGSIELAKVSSNQSLTLLFLTGARAIPIVLLVYLSSLNKQQPKLSYKLLMVVASALVLLTNFPSSTARFWAASVYLGLFITMIGIKYRNALVYMLLIGLNIIFPIMGQMTRGVKSLTEFVQSLSTANVSFKDNLFTGDYDAYSTLTYTNLYYGHFGASAKQFFSAIFFFVPRSIWPEKAAGSGFTIAHELGLTFDNISCPLPAEGLMSFGLLGVILFATLFSTVLFYFDRVYWTKSSLFIRMVYPFWLALFFFMMRGDFLSSFAYSVGLTSTFYLFVKVRKIRVVLKESTAKLIPARTSR